MWWSFLGVLAAVVALIWIGRSLRNRSRERAGRRCPACGGDLAGYEASPTCPHCYAILQPADPDEDDDPDEPDSVDEIDEDHDEARPW